MNQSSAATNVPVEKITTWEPTSEPRKVNKPIHKSEPSQVSKPIPRVNLSDNDSIMMFEWAKGEHNKNSGYKRTGLLGLLQATQVNLTDK